MLTETAIKNAKPKDKKFKLSDAGGLFLEVAPSGGKHWRMKYRYDGKEKLLTIGNYPAVSLKLARDARDKAKEKLGQGIDPSAAKQQAKADRQAQAVEAELLAYTFEQAFNDWHTFKQPSWTAGYSDDVLARGRMYLTPRLGKMALVDIQPIDVLDTLKRCEQAGKLDTLKKVRSILSQVLRYAVGTQKLNTDPSRDVPLDVFQKQEKRNHAHQVLPAEIRRIYQKINYPYKGSFEVANAMRLLPLTVLRANELCGLEWQEVDLVDRVLRIDAQRMKMKKAHIVPLSRQAVAILENQKAHHKGGDYVFPSPLTNSKPIRIEALLKAMRVQGIDKDTFTNHGWRHSFSTTMNERGFEPHIIELQLAHVLGGVQAVYNKAQYLDQRASMMQA